MCDVEYHNICHCAFLEHRTAKSILQLRLANGRLAEESPTGVSYVGPFLFSTAVFRSRSRIGAS